MDYSQKTSTLLDKSRSESSLRIKTYIFIALMVIFEPVGIVLLGKGMKIIPTMVSWAPADVYLFFSSALSSGMIWLGISSLLLFVITYLLVLSWADYSYVQPVTALSYGFTAVLAHFFLNEIVSPIHWAGVVLICVGVLVVGHTSPQTTKNSS